MENEIPKIYFDACCFIDIASYEIGGKIDTDRQDHIWYCYKLLEASQKKEVEVFTSQLTLVECLAAKNEKGEAIITDEIKRLFTSILYSGKGGVTPIQVSEKILLSARDLRWTHGIKLKGACDNIHLASALEIKCVEYISTDKKRWQQYMTDIEKLGITILFNGKDTKYLPDHYKQLNLDISINEEVTETPKEVEKDVEITNKEIIEKKNEKIEKSGE